MCNKQLKRWWQKAANYTICNVWYINLKILRDKIDASCDLETYN